MCIYRKLQKFAQHFLLQYHQNAYQVVSERGLIRYYDQRIISGAKFYSFKFNRTHTAFNLMGALKHKVDSITVSAQEESASNLILQHLVLVKRTDLQIFE